MMPNETPEERWHRVLGMAEAATADTVCVIRAHLYQEEKLPRLPTVGLQLSIHKSLATLAALARVIAEQGLTVE
jgi:hypothetical protein